MSNRYYELLKKWCDRLLTLQIKELKEKEFYGGIMCHSCSMIHGRIADCVYPLVYMYDKTKNEKYLDGARLAMDWAINNTRRKSFGFYNDKTSPWVGTTAFFQIAVGEALFYHSECLDSETKIKWRAIFDEQSEFIYKTFSSPGFSPNINYYAAEAASMAVAYRVNGKEKYKQRAYEKFEYIEGFFNDNGLLFGEGKPRDGVTPKGCNCVDIGYNMEESLPLLTLCGHMLNDCGILDFCEQKIMAHLEFMLPDGAIDNSFGTRANKWTYWGSRTSDGLQSGFVYLASKNPIISEAVQRNFELFEKCTYDGLLYGGAMYIDAGEEPCVHHTFCHAKALAAMLDNGYEYREKAVLPRDEQYGVKCMDSVGVKLISSGGFRATVSEYDFIYCRESEISGGTLSLLWHDKAKLIFAAAKNVVTEPKNMQHSRYDDKMECTAPRIAHGEYESVNDIEAKTHVLQSDNVIEVIAEGKLSTVNCNRSCESDYCIKYKFEENCVSISARSAVGGELILPLICGKNETAVLDKNCLTVESRKIKMVCNDEIYAPDGVDCRSFNTAGGFETIKTVIALEPDREAEVKIFIG